MDVVDEVITESLPTLTGVLTPSEATVALAEVVRERIEELVSEWRDAVPTVALDDAGDLASDELGPDDAVDDRERRHRLVRLLRGTSNGHARAPPTSTSVTWRESR